MMTSNYVHRILVFLTSFLIHRMLQTLLLPLNLVAAVTKTRPRLVDCAAHVDRPRLPSVQIPLNLTVSGSPSYMTRQHGSIDSTTTFLALVPLRHLR